MKLANFVTGAAIAHRYCGLEVQLRSRGDIHVLKLPHH
jgi:hypothetical protein